MNAGQVFRFLRWQAQLGHKWCRGGVERHLAVAHWRGDRLRRELAQLVKTSRTEVVIVGLVEHFGDIVAAEPAIRAVRRKHAGAMLVHVVGEKWLPLTARNPDINRHFTVRCLSEWYLASTCRGATVYDLHVPGRVCDICRSVTRQIKPAAAGIDINNYYQHGSLLDVFAKVGGVDLRAVDRQPRLHTPSGAAARQRAQIGGRYAIIHAASNQSHRDWAIDGWQKVIAALKAEGLKVTEVGLEPTLEGVGAIDMTGQPLEVTIDLIRGARLFLGVDSGPAHVANAVGTPSVVLLGHYGRYEKRMPFSGRLAEGAGGVIIHHDGPLVALPAEVVIDAARSLVRQAQGAEAGAP